MPSGQFGVYRFHVLDVVGEVCDCLAVLFVCDTSLDCGECVEHVALHENEMCYTVYHDGVFHAEGILWILGLGIMWGVSFYLVFTGFMKVAEKRADQNLKEKEQQNEE